ncbi:MAG TPA: hypothetical protein PK299_03440 [Anaerolineales bacterium]|nr:hypothetical protein [Anaerolineales bacterium]
MNEILHSPSFLGTKGNFATDITLVMMIAIALLFTYGRYLAVVKKDYETHRWVQTIGAVLNALMVGWMMILPFRDFIVRDLYAPQLPIFYAITWLHAATGLCALLFGLFVTLRGNGLMIAPLRFKKYKPYMRLAYTLYMAATLLGIVVYVVWFVINPYSLSYS